MLTPRRVRPDMKTQPSSVKPGAGPGRADPLLPAVPDNAFGFAETASHRDVTIMGRGRRVFPGRATGPAGARSQLGFTLMELMVVVVIVGIVAGLGIPSFARLIRDGELTSQTNSVVAALKTARSEAISRSVPVMVCPADTTATPADCDGNDWTNGWVVAEDADRDNKVDSSSDIIRQNSADTKISGASGDPARIRYTPEGLAEHDSTETISLHRPDCGPQKNREIEVSTTGRVQVRKVDC